MGNYKVVGDKVKIKSLDWYNKNKNKYGSVKAGNETFVPEMSAHCGKLATITRIFADRYCCHYSLDVDKETYSWTDEMLEDDEISNYNDVWEFGNLFIIVNEKDKKVFPDFYTTKEEAKKKLWEITK